MKYRDRQGREYEQTVTEAFRHRKVYPLFRRAVNGYTASVHTAVTWVDDHHRRIHGRFHRPTCHDGFTVVFAIPAHCRKACYHHTAQNILQSSEHKSALLVFVLCTSYADKGRLMQKKITAPREGTVIKYSAHR